MESNVLIQLAMVIVIGIASQWIAWRMRLPAIVLLLLGGILMGPVMGFLNPDNALGESLVPIVSLSVAIILFEGGMSLKVRELKGTGRVLAMLVTVGALITWYLSYLFAAWLLGMEKQLAILFGAILVVTGPTVIGPLLRHVRPIGKSGTILKWEGLTIDPIGAIAAVLVYEFLFADLGQNSAKEAITALVSTFGVGTLVGLAGAGFTVAMLKKFWLPDYLVNPASVAIVFLVFVGSNHFRTESGIVAVTIMGFALANQRWVKVGHILEFKENLRVLLISSLFILLAARLDASILGQITWKHALFILALLVVVRPASVFISTLGSDLTKQERIFMCFMAPRGIVAAAVASIFALELGNSVGGETGDLLMTNVFLVVISTVVIYGFAALPIARKLGLARPEPNGMLIVGSSEFSRDFAAVLHSLKIPVQILDTNTDKVKFAETRGIESSAVNYLDESEREEFDISSCGQLLAMTPNDSANELLNHKGAEDFGRAKIFKLARDSKRRGERSHDEGRILFDSGLTFGLLQEKLQAGMRVQSEKIDETNEQDWKTKFETVTPLLIVISDGSAILVEAGSKHVLREGHTIVFLAHPATKS